MTAGYSGTPLIKKLGIKPGFKIALLHVPDNYHALIGPMPANVEIAVADDLAGRGPLDFVHFFTRQSAELAAEFPVLKALLAPDGMLWISWPKKASKLATDLNENIIRDIGLRAGLVDVKVAAIDERWSGLKFVYRLVDRAAPAASDKQQ